MFVVTMLLSATRKNNVLILPESEILLDTATGAKKKRLVLDKILLQAVFVPRVAINNCFLGLLQEIARSSSILCTLDTVPDTFYYPLRFRNRQEKNNLRRLW